MKRYGVEEQRMPNGQDGGTQPQRSRFPPPRYWEKCVN